MVSNIGKITTMGGTTGLVDQSDKMHTGLLKVLEAYSKGDICISHADFTITDGGTYTQYNLLQPIKFRTQGQFKTYGSDISITYDTTQTSGKPTAAQTQHPNYTRYDLISMVPTDTPTLVITLGTLNGANGLVPDLPTGNIPIALIEVTAGTDPDKIDYNIQLYTLDLNTDVYLGTLKVKGDQTLTDGHVLTYSSSTGKAALAAPSTGITGVTAGTNLSGGGSSGTVTLNVDDAFLINSGDDTTTGTITAGGFTTAGSITLGGHAFDDIDIGSEFTDADDHLMSSGAIKEKIESYTYLTAEADTLDTVTGRGASTANGVVLNGGLICNSIVDFGSTITHNKNAAPNDAATINPTITATMNYLNDPSGTATLPAPTAYTDTVITIKNVHPTTMTITPTTGTIDNGLINHDKRVTVTNTIKLLQGESITLQAIADGGIAGSVAEGWYIADTDTNFAGAINAAGAITAVEGESTLALSGSVTVATGQTFVSPRLPVVSLNTSTPLTEAAHAGRYIFVTGSGTVITIPDNQGAGVHFTIVNNDGNGFTLRTGSGSSAGDTMNGAQTDIAVAARNGVTCISDGSNNYVVLGA